MASPHSENHSENHALLSRLQEAARRGDWQEASRLAAMLQQQNLPPGREELTEYLALLKAALIAARASRADAVASLSRLNAAASFNRTPPDAAPADAAPERQNFADPPDF